MILSPNHKFPSTPHKEIKRSEGISKEKNGRDPLGGTNFFLYLSRNEVKKLWGVREKNDCRNSIRIVSQKKYGLGDKYIDKHRMRNNPHDWQIGTLKNLAGKFDIEWRQPGTSHVTFRHPNGAKITVPAHRPVKPIYIKKFIRLIDEGEGE